MTADQAAVDSVGAPPPTSFAQLRRAAQPHRRLLAVTATLAAISAVLEIGVITIIAAFAGRLLSDGSEVPVFSDLSEGALMGAAALVVAAKISTDLMFAAMQSRTLYNYESGLRRKIAFLQARCSWATIEDSKAGSIHSLLWTSVNRSRDGFVQLIGIFTSITSLLLMLAAVIVTAHWMVVPVFAGVVVFGLIFYPLIRATKQASVELRHAYESYGAELNESIAMSREARVLGVQDRIAARLADASNLAAHSLARQSFYSTLMASGYSNALYAAVIIGFAFLSGAEINDPAPLAATVLLLYRSLTYGRGLQSSLQSITAAAPFLADVHEWLDVLESATETIDEAPAVAGFDTIEFRDVGLTYANGHIGLDGISTTIKRGESVALVGASGSGKSSLITLLLGLRDHTSGSISIDGQPLEALDRRSWRSLLALVSQDTVLFNDTIEENVRCWRDISGERVLESLRQANILDEVLAMEDGLGSEVGEGGKRLSGGQRQRICLARALAGDPALLVLDEPTSALDPASERAVKNALEAIKGQVTILIIAHRMTTITICDRVLVLDRGHLEHDGAAEIVARNSEYFARALDLSEGM